MTATPYEFPTAYQQFVFKSRYARYLQDEGRRENWEETVKRYLDFFEEHLADTASFKLDEDLYNDLFDAIASQSVMPSMRALMTAGPALKRDHVAGYNCFAGEQRLLTKEWGLTDFRNVEGQDVHVWTSNKQWEKARIVAFGQQPLLKLSVGYNSKSRDIFVTANHRWLVEGKVKLTSELKRGDKLPFNPITRSVNENSTDYRLGVIHGLVYGDGAQQKYKNYVAFEGVKTQTRDKGYVVRLCSDQQELSKWFEGYPVSYPKTHNGDPVYYLFDNFAKTHSLKELPLWQEESDDYMIGFFRGWLAADGTVSKEAGQVSICVGLEEQLWLEQIMPKYGYEFMSHTKLEQSNTQYKQNKSSRNLLLFRPSLTEEDFIIKRKRDKFKSFRYELTVRSVEETDRNEFVYCAQVPTTEDFTLDYGLLTKNCAYLGFEQPKSFDEEMFILMNGTGVGFSVESDYTTQLPIIAEDFHETETTIVVDDSRIGWAKSFRELITLLYTGQIPRWDLSRLRPAGARLKTFGGRSSGPEPLNQLFKFTVEMFKRAAGRRLTTIECHDLGCMVANIVVVGGVRRSALISLSDLTDDKMRDAKSGAWWNAYGYRRLANNSAVYDERPDVGVFIREWLSLYDSKSGERGIFNRGATKRVIENANDFRVKLLGSSARLREIGDWAFGTNPCSEIILRAMQFCNLTEVIVREEDTLKTLLWKVRIATILGTFQSTLTNFKYLNSKWRRNCEDERLLGVSLTGILDNPILNGSMGEDALVDTLERMKAEAIKVNHELAQVLGINPSAAITCVKPSGTVSSLVNTSSGIHPRHAPYYIRYVRNSNNDPVTHFLKEAGVPWEPDVMDPNNTVCFKYPIKSPDNSIFKKDLTAIQHLELWKKYQIHWCEHKPSVTVTVKEHEWLEVGAWVYANFEWMSGISFLPDDGNHTYQQAPFTTCSKEEYETLLAQMPEVDWSLLPKYEKEDATTGMQELACSSASGCEI